MTFRHIGVASLLAFAAAAVHGAKPLAWGEWDTTVAEVSMTELLASGERYSGWKVSVIGVLSYSGDKDMLFSSQESFSNYDFPSAIGIFLHEAVEAGLSRRALEAANGKFVRIQGQFRPYRREQLDEDVVRIGFPVAGDLKSVTYIEQIERRR